MRRFHCVSLYTYIHLHAQFSSSLPPPTSNPKSRDGDIKPRQGTNIRLRNREGKKERKKRKEKKRRKEEEEKKVNTYIRIYAEYAHTSSHTYTTPALFSPTSLVFLCLPWPFLPACLSVCLSAFSLLFKAPPQTHPSYLNSKHIRVVFTYNKTLEPSSTGRVALSSSNFSSSARRPYFYCCCCCFAQSG